MKYFLSFLFLSAALAFSATASAQTKPTKTLPQKVVFQVSSNDTLVHKSLVKQLNNLLTALDQVTIEVVTHGPGVSMLQQNSTVKNNLQLLQQRGVVFLVCRNTLTEKKIDPKTLLPFARIIPAGLAHIITRQSEGWSYIKAGF